MSRSKAATVTPGSLPQRNFNDQEILGKMQKLNVPSAQLSSDEDFFRRINLDLTGRIPGSEDVRAFVAESNKDKRDAVIDRLLASPEFTDRWTMWMGDLLAEHCQPCCRSRQPRTPGTQRVLFLH